MPTENAVVHTQHTNHDAEDLTAPYYELEAFDSVWQALRWKHVRARVPICFKKTLRSRYMLANLVYLGYAIGILIIDFNPSVYAPPENETACINLTEETPDLSTPVCNVPLVNNLYLGLGVVHLISAFLYWWAWADHTWNEIIMIPEYLNHLEASLYIWSASWYSREDTLGGYYTLAIHRIEMTAATVELVASFGWIMSWYLTYIRTFSRGWTLDDPDTVAWLATTISSFVYMTYNIQINLYPEQYGTNYLYTYGDIVYFLGSCYYIFAALRDENWFWFLPVAGQYGVAVGKIKVETKKPLPSFGKPPIYITRPCELCIEKIKNKKNKTEPVQKTTV